MNADILMAKAHIDNASVEDKCKMFSEDMASLQSFLLESFIETQSIIKTSDEEIQVVRSELAATKQRNNILEADANELKNLNEKLKAECEEYNKALNLANAEIEVLRKTAAVSSSAAVVQPLIGTQHLDANVGEAVLLDSNEVKGMETVKGKDKSLKETRAPSDFDLRMAIRCLLTNADISKTTFMDCLKQLDQHFKVDLALRKTDIKHMIKEELSKIY
ncbi:hypothetical protein AQUCO_00300064v1 [Aquilegia coerulea]|uniref:DEK-C domain-containing protein n=1 Tax=Aquilegia coerulea TaxID=218851 RepID=A0A2G5EX47_AQUCA|nr:hypothetical protein AQUCO_00300064v1 [Aquilegia coerulea]